MVISTGSKDCREVDTVLFFFFCLSGFTRFGISLVICFNTIHSQV